VVDGSVHSEMLYQYICWATKGVQVFGLLATLVPVKDSMGVHASLNLWFGMTLIATFTILNAYGQRFAEMVLSHLCWA